MPSLSDVDPQVNIVLHSFPLPIAHQVRHLLDVASENRRGQYEQLKEVVGFTLRYCAVVLLSQYTADDKVRQDTLDRDISDTIENLSAEVCVTYIRRILEAYSLYPERLFIPEMRGLRYEADGARSGNLDLLHRLARYTDEAVDTAEVRAESFYVRKYEDAYKDWQQLVEALTYLKDYTLVRLIGQSEEAGRYYGRLQILHGVAYDQEERPESDAPFPEFDLAVRQCGDWQHRAPTLEDWLPLKPFALFHDCPECRRQQHRPSAETFYYRQAKRPVANFVGLEEDEANHPHSLALEDMLVLIDQVTQYEEHARELTWEGLARNATRLTNEQLFRLVTKYWHDLYRQRDAAWEHYTAFRASEATGFLVVGDSGAGKTNFLCNLAEHEMNQGHLVLLESCSDLGKEALALDVWLAQRLKCPVSEQGLIGAVCALDQRWPEHKPVVLLFDAINEFVEPIGLLQALVGLVQQARDLPWLKIVISCRTESWTRFLRPQFEGGEEFYRVGTGAEVPLARFNETELQDAYGLYQKKFNLRTEFNALSAEVVERLSDPLMLRIISEAYRGQELPAAIANRKLFQLYEKEKIGHPTDAKIGSEEERVVDRLLDLLLEAHKDEILYKDLAHDGRVGAIVRDPRVTSAYVRLLDKGVLKESGNISVRDVVKVRFSYDRMFEYLLTKKIVKGGLDLPQVRQLVEESRRFPSLWGAVRFLLIDQLEDDPPRTELLTAICLTPNNVDLTNLAIDTLLVYAGQSVASCSEVERYAIQTLLPKSVASAGMVAAQVGYQLILADILEGCLLSSVEETNQLATLYTFYLWSHRPEEDNGRAMAAEVFNRIYGHVKKTLSPRGIVKLIGPGLRRQLSLDQMKGIRPLIELSILLVGYQYHQPEGVREPEGIREVGDVMLSFLNRIPGGPIRWLVFQSMKHFAASTAHEAVGNAGVINLRTLRPFFDRPLDDPFRKECVDLIDYLDPYGTPVATIADKLFPLAQEEDAVLYYVLEYVLMPRVGTDYEGVYSFAQRLYREGNIQSKFAALRVFTMVTYMELGRPYVKQEHFDFCQEMVFGCLEGEEMRVRFSWKESKDSPLELRTFGTNHLYMLILYECFNRQGGALACVDRALNLKVDRIDPLEITQDLTTTLKEYGLKDPQMLQEFQNDLLGADPHTVLEVKVILDLGWAVLLGSGTRRTNVDPIMVTLRRWSMVEDGAKLIAMSLTLSVIRSCFPREVDQFLAESSSELRRTVAANLMLVPVAKMISISYQALSGMVQQFPALRQAVIPPLIWHGLHGTSVDLCAQECGRNIADYKVLYDLAEGVKGTLPGMHQEQSRQ